MKFEVINIDPRLNAITDYPGFLIRELDRLSNALESKNQELLEEKNKNRALIDEINILKGEQGLPKFSKKKNEKIDYSSEKERKQPYKEKKGRRKRNFKIKNKEVEYCLIPPDQLPLDAEFKGYREVTVQDLIVKPRNIQYKIGVYYSRSEGKTYCGQRPDGYQDEFGAGVLSTIFSLKYESNASNSAIHSFLTSNGIYISLSTISRLSTKNLDKFHQEKREVVLSGFKSTLYQHIDDTGSLVNGSMHHTHILCNPYYTAYFTTPKKDRLTVLKILSLGRDLLLQYDLIAFDLMKRFSIPKKLIESLRTPLTGKIITEKELEEIFCSLSLKVKQKESLIRRLKEAGAISYYRTQKDFPVIEILISDDAKQFSNIIEEQALCWIHAARHFKKINPLLPQNNIILEEI